jgi:hypothetical protein
LEQPLSRVFSVTDCAGAASCKIVDHNVCLVADLTEVLLFTIIAEQ